MNGDDAVTAAGKAVEGFGGFLRCEVCGDQMPMTPGRSTVYVRNGWPLCHGYTMRWWTARQIAAGEVPPVSASVKSS